MGKYNLANISGRMELLEDTLAACLKSRVFYPEKPSDVFGAGFTVPKEENPFLPLLKQAGELCGVFGFKYRFSLPKGKDMTLSSAADFLGSLQKEADSVKAGRDKQNAELKIHTDCLEHMKLLCPMEESFAEVFGCRYAKCRFGRLSDDSFLKLRYYENRTFFFIPFSEHDGYHYGCYFAPEARIEVVDYIFDSLSFERLNIPDSLTETPAESVKVLEAQINGIRQHIKNTDDRLLEVREQHNEAFSAILSWLTLQNMIFSMRKYAVFLGNRFSLFGYVSQKNLSFLKEQIESVGAHCEISSAPGKPYRKIRSLYDKDTGFPVFKGGPA